MTEIKRKVFFKENEETLELHLTGFNSTNFVLEPEMVWWICFWDFAETKKYTISVKEKSSEVGVFVTFNKPEYCKGVVIITEVESLQDWIEVQIKDKK